MISFGPGIFWTSLAAVAAVLSLATLIGRAWSRAFPYKLQALAGFYLAPVLGLATLTIIASLAGRFVPLGNAIAIPLMTVSLLVYLLIRERHAGQALYHVLMVSVFGIACGASMLGPLFVDGGFNSHNDAFTYLTHGRWLQDHAFGDAIPDDQITPQNTQIALYQQAGLRMGASFLLALFQSLLNLRWSYEVYPAVVIAAIAVCCLAIGFPLARTLRSMRRGVRLALLAFPAFSLGGLVFGANLGFMPQVVGMAMGAGLLFMLGPVYRWIAVAELRWPSMAKTAFPGAALLAGMIFSYSEIAPFMLAAVFGSGFLMAFRFRAWKKTLVFGAALAGIAGVLLNTELARTYAALRGQASVVVGSPVDWSPLGYLAHAFGVHGGAWDGYQWTSPGENRPSVLWGWLGACCADSGALSRQDASCVARHDRRTAHARRCGAGRFYGGHSLFPVCRTVAFSERNGAKLESIQAGGLGASVRCGAGSHGGRGFAAAARKFVRQMVRWRGHDIFRSRHDQRRLDRRGAHQAVYGLLQRREEYGSLLSRVQEYGARRMSERRDDLSGAWRRAPQIQADGDGLSVRQGGRIRLD
ncbi:MAG: hypothetical protein WDO70_09075 [Alphaproteobacteria bacterium]